MGREALLYRAQRGLLDRDEQMALLVQRVSGACTAACSSRRSPAWGCRSTLTSGRSTSIPEPGVVRLVFGLGTRAVRRSDDDYTRIVALNAPARRPETTSSEVRGYAQCRVDVLDLEKTEHRACSFEEVFKSCSAQSIEMVAWRDPELMRQSRETGRPAFPWVLTFKKLLSETSFVTDMRALLETLEKAYDYPVDVEFTTNFLADGSYRINLVQCRPFQVKGGGPIVAQPEAVADARSRPEDAGRRHRTKPGD